MTEHVHSHSRSTDAGKVVLPGWLKSLIAVSISLIVGTVATLSWMDGRYTPAKDTQVLRDQLNEKLDVIQKGQNDLREDMKDIKRAMYRRNP
jgi:hypothetical protein